MLISLQCMYVAGNMRLSQRHPVATNEKFKIDLQSMSKPFVSDKSSFLVACVL